jgi:hypothetical protein
MGLYYATHFGSQHCRHQLHRFRNRSWLHHHHRQKFLRRLARHRFPGHCRYYHVLSWLDCHGHRHQHSRYLSRRLAIAPGGLAVLGQMSLLRVVTAGQRSLLARLWIFRLRWLNDFISWPAVVPRCDGGFRVHVIWIWSRFTVMMWLWCLPIAIWCLFNRRVLRQDLQQPRVVKLWLLIPRRFLVKSGTYELYEFVTCLVRRLKLDVVPEGTPSI